MTHPSNYVSMVAISPPVEVVLMLVASALFVGVSAWTCSVIALARMALMALMKRKPARGDK